MSDTYYINFPTTVLRTHTSAHQTPLLKAGETKFLVTGPVARKDEVNKTHSSVFHQMEGVCVYSVSELLAEVCLPGLIIGCNNNHELIPNIKSGAPVIDVKYNIADKILSMTGNNNVEPKSQVKINSVNIFNADVSADIVC